MTFKLKPEKLGKHIEIPPRLCATKPLKVCMCFTGGATVHLPILAFSNPEDN
jgi:hypothetical protein